MSLSLLWKVRQEYHQLKGSISIGKADRPPASASQMMDERYITVSNKMLH